MNDQAFEFCHLLWKDSQFTKKLQNIHTCCLHNVNQG